MLSARGRGTSLRGRGQCCLRLVCADPLRLRPADFFPGQTSETVPVHPHACLVVRRAPSRHQTGPRPCAPWAGPPRGAMVTSKVSEPPHSGSALGAIVTRKWRLTEVFYLREPAQISCFSWCRSIALLLCWGGNCAHSHLGRPRLGHIFLFSCDARALPTASESSGMSLAATEDRKELASRTDSE